MEEPDQVERLAAEADRLDELAATATLMGDDAGADRFHAQAARRRLQAMRHLDQRWPLDEGGA